MAHNIQSKLESISFLPGGFPNGRLASDYSDNHVDEILHPAFSDSGIGNERDADYHCDVSGDVFDEKTLFNCQQAFVHELQQYQDGADPRYKTGVDLMSRHTWSDVIAQVDIARREFRGEGKKSISKIVANGLEKFSTAAPAVEQWLQLLPNNTLYGSVLCGGLTIILEAAVRLGKLRQDTYDAIDQIPLRIENAQFFVQTYNTANVEEQAARLYQAIIEALQHILAYYKRKAGIRFLGAFLKGDAYAKELRKKMKNVVDASQAMDYKAGLNQHYRLKEIKSISQQTKSQLSIVEKRTEELKELQLEARSHLYAVFRDTEAWQEALQKKSLVVKELLLKHYNEDAISQDVEDALRQYTTIPLVDQDRAAAIIRHPSMSTWLEDPKSGAILVHGNCRRHDPISPTSIASAVILNCYAKTDTFFTLYWFCGSHMDGPECDALGMIRSLICQLLIVSAFEFSLEKRSKSSLKDLEKMLDLFKGLVQQLPNGTAIICIIDGISYYEGEKKHSDTCKGVQELVQLTRAREPRFKLLITSPTRTSHIHLESNIADNVVLVDIPSHVNGAKQGFNHQLIVPTTEKKVRRLSHSLLNEEREKKMRRLSSSYPDDEKCS